MARLQADSAGCSQDVVNGAGCSIEQLADLAQGTTLLKRSCMTALCASCIRSEVTSWSALLAPDAVILLHRPVAFITIENIRYRLPSIRFRRSTI